MRKASNIECLIAIGQHKNCLLLLVTRHIVDTADWPKGDAHSVVQLAFVETGDDEMRGNKSSGVSGKRLGGGKKNEGKI